MKKTRLTALPLVIIAAVALVLGTFGTAQASGLTIHKVKQIAAGVVNHKASSLSVAHASRADNATNADNANLLNGQPGSTYKNTAYRYRLPAFASTSSKTFTFNGLPQGSYLVDYNLIVTGGSTGTFCYFPVTGAPGEGFQYGSTPGGYTTVNGSAVLTVGSSAPTMFCSGGASFSSYNFSDVTSSVQFLKLDTVNSTGLTASRASSDAPSGAPGSATR